MGLGQGFGDGGTFLGKSILPFTGSIVINKRENGSREFPGRDLVLRLNMGLG